MSKAESLGSFSRARFAPSEMNPRKRRTAGPSQDMDHMVEVVAASLGALPSALHASLVLVLCCATLMKKRAVDHPARGASIGPHGSAFCSPIAAMMSEPNTNAPASAPAPARKKDTPPLAFEDTLRDLAILRASSVDLAAVLASNTTLPTTSSADTTVEEVSVARSYEFAQAARAAIKIRNRGDVEAQVERVNDVRDKLEDVALGLQE